MARKKVSLPQGVAVPDHVAIIPDGDRRWGRAQGKTPMQGHLAGIKRMVELARASRDMGIHTVTAWGLSTENWIERPKAEVEFLFRGISEHLKAHLAEAKKDRARIVHLGRKDRMPAWFLEELAKAEKETINMDKHIVNLALDYNGRDEIVRAINKLQIANCSFGKAQDKKLQVTKEDIEANLDTAGQPYPYPDMIIRTSGEQRTSGFLLWQSEYSEFYFEQDNFPDFTVEKYIEAICDLSRRRRRFGGNDAMAHPTFKPEVVAKFELAWWRASNAANESGLTGLVVSHLKEQFGISKDLARETAGHLVEALRERRRGKNWEKVKENMAKFYTIIKQEIGYAFEPKIVAGLEVRWMKEAEEATTGASNLKELEETAKNLYAEVYRISLLQAAKAAHLRALAAVERALAVSGIGNSALHWAKAEDYLVRFYRALKERVA